MIYYYNGSSYGYVLYESDNTPIKKGDDIIFQDTIGEIISVNKEKCKILIKDTDDKIEIKNKELKKCDMRYIIDIIQNFIELQKSKINIPFFLRFFFASFKLFSASIFNSFASFILFLISSILLSKDSINIFLPFLKDKLTKIKKAIATQNVSLCKSSKKLSLW